MLLAPGPIPLITGAWYDAPIEDPGNVAAVQSFDQQFNDLEVLLDSASDPAAPIDLNLPDDGNAPDLAAIDVSLTAIGGVDPGIEGAAGAVQYQDLTEKMYNVFAAAPAEVFQPLPDALAAPVGGPVVGQASQVAADLKNLTRPGATDFYVGDQYEIDVHLAPAVGGGGKYAGIDVRLFPLQNGVLVGVPPGSPSGDPNDLCLTDDNGFLTAVGAFGPLDVGQWHLTLAYTVPGYTGSALGQNWVAPLSIFEFTVTAGPGVPLPAVGAGAPVSDGLHPVQTLGQPCAGSAINVMLANTSQPGAPNFLSGDNWTLTVIGQANSDVLISALFNGVALQWIVLGQTDDTGTFVLKGSMNDAVVGTWVEYYEVGSQRWSGNLSFSVAPALV